MAKKYLDGINFDAPSKGFQGTLTIRDTEARGLIQDNANAIATVTAAQQATAQQVATNTSDITDLDTRTTAIEGDNAIIHAKDMQQDNRLRTLEENVATAETGITDLDGRVTAIEGDNAVIHAKDMQQDTRLRDLEANVATAEGDITDLEDRMTTAEGDIDALDGRVTDAEGDITDIKAKDVEQDAHLADLDDRVAASTYEAGIGIYFGQGAEHTNINVDDEIIDQINQNTQDIDELLDTKTEIYTEVGGTRTNYPELTIDESLEIVSYGGVNTLKVGSYIIDYTLGSNMILTPVYSDANTQAVTKILEVLNAGGKPTVYARLSMGQNVKYIIPCNINVVTPSGNPATAFTLAFLFSFGYDSTQLRNTTYVYQDTLTLVSTTVTHDTHMTDLRATRVNSGYADANPILSWDMPGLFKPYKYFNTEFYFDEDTATNDYYQSAPYAVAWCDAEYVPVDGATFYAELDNFTDGAGDYPELPSMMYIHFKRQTETTGEAYWIPLTKMVYETTADDVTTGAIPFLTGTFTDRTGQAWKVVYNVSDNRGVINALDPAPQAILLSGTTQSVTVRNSAMYHAIARKICDNMAEHKKYYVQFRCDYTTSTGTSYSLGAYDIEVINQGVNTVTLAFKYKLPADANQTNNIYYVTDDITLGSAEDGSGDTHTFRTLKIAGTAM